MLSLAACGGKSAPAQEPAPAGDSGSAADGDDRGIGAAEAAAGACYEQCFTDGAQGATDWAAKSEQEKQDACNAECKDAGAGLPSDQPAQ